MGCVLVKKWHVEFDYEGHDGLDGWTSPSTTDNLVITEITPKIPAGWYVRTDLPVVSEVYHFNEDELEDVVSDWLDKHMRVNPPTPYVEEKYTDGYYLTDEGVRCRRIDGVWEFMFSEENWLESSFTDDNIEAEGHVTFVPED